VETVQIICPIDKNPFLDYDLDMYINLKSKRKNAHAQIFLNGEIHDWYRIIWGYSDHLVSGLLEEFNITAGEVVLDPFCGTGTTLIECMKKGVGSIGIDANPSSYFASKTKTEWSLVTSKIINLIKPIKTKYYKNFIQLSNLKRDPTYLYLEASGMLKRGWISARPLYKVIALKKAIDELDVPQKYKNLFKLALMSEVVSGAANIKFGPELYCTTPKEDHDVLGKFVERVMIMVDDLKKTKGINIPVVFVVQGDARDCSHLVKKKLMDKKIDGIICSPPYPTEHDYTRNSRLELALLESVTDRKMLQSIKRQMIRSHTKGIYVEDNDSILVSTNVEIQKITKLLRKKITTKTHGFAKLYPKVTQEYFGGMLRHFKNVKPLLKSGAYCAYVVGDQASYLQVPVPTATILSSLAKSVGFELVDIRTWRTRWSTTTSREIKENILILRNPL
jgi:hypothetical protein